MARLGVDGISTVIGNLYTMPGVGGREWGFHVRNTDALSGSFAKCDEVLLQTVSFCWIHPSFWVKFFGVGEGFFVVME